MDIKRAISIRQPYVELILRGIKKKEYRTRLTHIRERVFVYASAKPADWPRGWTKVGKQPGELPTQAVVGTVEITDCRWDANERCYAYKLKNPRRLRSPLLPTNPPQPGFWRPKF